MRSSLTAYNPQFENFLFDEYEAGEAETYGEAESTGVFSPAQEMELAAELLELRDEAELDRFLGNLIRNVGQAAGKFINSPAGQALGGVLKGAAKNVLPNVLPLAGGALGGLVGGPLGAKIGSGLASMAGQALGLELEGLSAEDREFEAAKQFVRFAGETVKNAISAPPSNSLATVAKQAAIAAAQRHAPGLLLQGGNTQGGSDGPGQRSRSGRWVRRGRSIVIINC